MVIATVSIANSCTTIIPYTPVRICDWSIEWMVQVAISRLGL